MTRAGPALTGLLLIALSITAITAAESATAAPLAYRNAAEEARFHALTTQLRCVQCQNQSLADSEAQIAQDLRREVLTLIQQGRSDREIKGFLLARYGDFVLYQPPLQRQTWLLWFGPLALLLAGGAIVLRVVRRQRGQSASDSFEESQ